MNQNPTNRAEKTSIRVITIQSRLAQKQVIRNATAIKKHAILEAKESKPTTIKIAPIKLLPR